MFVGYIHADDVSATFHTSVLGLLLWDLQHEARILGGGGHAASYCGTGRLADGRNELVRKFLDDSKCEWLWMVDTDMGFDPDTVERLIAAADPKERPVVGALCFGQRIVDVDPNNATPRFVTFPTVYTFRDEGDASGFASIYDYPKDSLMRVAGTGAACLVIHRSAVEKMRAEDGDHWFTPVSHKGEFFGEDLSFCVRLARYDLPLHVHTAVKTTHAKGGYLSEERFMAELGQLADEKVRGAA